MWFFIILGLIFLIIYFPIGILFIIIGLIIGATRKSKEEKGIPTVGKKKCPKCAELVLVDALICKHCGNEDFSPKPKTKKKVEITAQCPECSTLDTNPETGWCNDCNDWRDLKKFKKMI